jgi:hypothetical protein
LFGGLVTGGSPTTATVADARLIPLPTVIAPRNGVPFTLPIGELIDRNPFAKASDFTVTIDWGDGSPTTSGTLISRGGGVFLVSGSHTYTVKGKQQITITVEDEGGSSTTIHSRANVRGN